MEFFKYWAPPILYMALIFAGSSVEQPPLPMPEFEWLTIDKLYHFIEYAILGALLTRAFVKGRPLGRDTEIAPTTAAETGVPRHYVWFMAALLSSLYGASDEWHQTFVPGRSATLADWIADVLGSIAGAFGVYRYYKKKMKKRNEYASTC